MGFRSVCLRASLELAIGMGFGLTTTTWTAALTPCTTHITTEASMGFFLVITSNGCSAPACATAALLLPVLLLLCSACACAALLLPVLLCSCLYNQRMFYLTVTRDSLVLTLCAIRVARHSLLCSR